MNRIYLIGAAFVMMVVMASCSTTSAIDPEEQLYTGLKSVDYRNYDYNQHFIATQEEIDAALATAPTGSFMGSSFISNPVPIGLWIWNATEGRKGGIARWLNSSFGTPPVLMSDVNPRVRASVAEATLANNGYFRGSVDYKEITMKNPRKGKISYDVNMGHLFTFDTISYANYPAEMLQYIYADSHNAAVREGDGFSVAALDAERERVSLALRNKGYYYYQPAYASYFADTLAVPGAVQLRLQLADSLDASVYKKWYIGRTEVNLRKRSGEQLADSAQRGSLTVRYNGKKAPIRPRVILSNMSLRPKQHYSEAAHRQSLNLLSTNDIFSSIDISFQPRNNDMTATDTLDMTINCVFDKPWDLALEGKFTGKTSSRIGPGVNLSVTKRNAFRYGEKLSFNVYGSYEWQTGGSGAVSNVAVNSYEYGADVTLEMPRLLLPFWKNRRWSETPTTLIKASNQVINRGSYFNRHIMSGELSYMFHHANTSRHIVSPLILEYDYMNSKSAGFDAVLDANPYLKLSMQDQFIPKVRYTFEYTSKRKLRNPIHWESTFSESANVVSLAYAMAGKGFSEKNKKMLGNPFAQFVKLETDFTKKWRVAESTDLVAHVSAGVVYSYGNSTNAPYSEQFYVGGANSIRAFTVRSVGPGRTKAMDKYSALFSTGDMKFVANIEYRPRLMGNLYGAAFLDMGNIWNLRDGGIGGRDTQFRLSKALNDMALGTGIGIRYDLEFFVIRVDWGVGLHMPYNTSKSGYFNIPHFKGNHSLHLAVGYPF